MGVRPCPWILVRGALRPCPEDCCPGVRCSRARILSLCPRWIQGTCLPLRLQWHTTTRIASAVAGIAASIRGIRIGAHRLFAAVPSPVGGYRRRIDRLAGPEWKRPRVSLGPVPARVPEMAHFYLRTSHRVDGAAPDEDICSDGLLVDLCVSLRNSCLAPGTVARFPMKCGGQVRY
eukprot:gene14329-biopygen8089